MTNSSRKLDTVFDRSNKESYPFSRLLFSILRAIDPYVQYLLIFQGYGYQLLSKIGLPIVPAGPKGKILVAMAAGCAAKQIINMTYILEVKVIYPAVIGICLYNTLSNSIASFSSIIYSPSNELGSLQYVGISLFTVGIFTELISEIQRKRFKDNPINKGKVYTGGLFSLARHINYGGYTLWRTGLALTSGNYWWAGLQFIWHVWYFTKLGVPELNGYCSSRYGEQWKKFECDVPNTLFPYLW